MIYKRFIHCSLALATLAIVLSCQKDEYTIDSMSSMNPITDIRANLPIDRVNLTSSDALAVAKQLIANNNATKADTSLDENCVSTIYDKNGSPVIYAINLTDGYYLLSASKTYFPVLAYVKHGHYPPEEESGVGVVVKEMIDAVSLSRIDEKTGKKYKASWRVFEESEFSTKINTKSSASYSAYIESLYNNYIPAWRSQGYNVYFLRDQPSLMPTDMYQSFYDQANQSMEWVEGFNIETSAIILERIENRTSGVSPLISTQWSQWSPYNSADPLGRVLGCVTIAVGQIMKYHQHPGYSSSFPYDWSLMPNTSSSTSLSNFLYFLRGQLGVTNDGNSSIDMASNYLNAVGYRTTNINHYTTSVVNSLNQSRPLYMKGKSPTTGEGHAWVCDGYSSYTQEITYSILIPLFDGEYVWDMEELNNQFIMGPSNYTLFHMNWGLAGVNDGYFYDSSIDYTVQRKDLLISR